eukprot:CAMPEP_0195645562 /NCGR_PEP_ID=MMETSP0815-20121206/29006_1 /TAXON_ID=97485 /ORGANISM="Prymnesium parvum, Strain Texoma1" /LENGTH=125 /DNA_ID=CAMNT_0040788821 /DNA_START=310 /DNA_END=682 /DNA_ORIENTATION=-
MPTANIGGHCSRGSQISGSFIAISTSFTLAVAWLALPAAGGGVVLLLRGPFQLRQDFRRLHMLRLLSEHHQRADRLGGARQRVCASAEDFVRRGGDGLHEEEDGDDERVEVLQHGDEVDRAARVA